MAEGKERVPEKISAPEGVEENIEIPALTLRDKVKIEGRDIWGRDATMSLVPSGKSGWYLRVQDDNGAEKDVLITPDMLRSGYHHLYLTYNGKAYARVCEHLLPLRFAGIDGVCIVPKKGNEWLPWTQGGLDYWRAVEENLEPADPLSPMKIGVNISVQKTEKNGLHRTASVDTATNQAGLIAAARVNFRDFGGTREVTRKFPDSMANMYDLFAAKTLGQPPWLEHVVRFVSKFGWPHAENVLWAKKDMVPHEVLMQIALHRYFDMLGAMGAVAGPGEFLAGDLKTREGNHALDVTLVRAMSNALKGEQAEQDRDFTHKPEPSLSLANAVAPLLRKGPAYWGEAFKNILSTLNIRPVYTGTDSAGFAEMRGRLNTPGVPAIIIANHPSPLDVGIIFSPLTRPDVFLVVRKNSLQGFQEFLGAENVIGISEEPEDIESMLKSVRSQLANGGAVVYFPTGGADSGKQEISFQSGIRRIIEEAPEGTHVHAVHIDPEAGNRIRAEVVGPPRTPDEYPELLARSLHVRKAESPIDVPIKEHASPVSEWKKLLIPSASYIEQNKTLTNHYLDLVK